MMPHLNKTLFAVALSAAFIFTPAIAEAKCKKFGFTVNDYGKEGPTADAKRLLDKFVAEWMQKNGIKNYRTSPKKVSCELFLDVILFDEYTCRADTTACWGAPAKKKIETEAEE